MSDEWARMPCYQRIWPAPSSSLPLSLSFSSQYIRVCGKKKKEGGGGGENLEEGNTGDILRQVADTKGTGHSPTPGYFIPCLVPYPNPPLSLPPSFIRITSRGYISSSQVHPNAR